MHFTCQRFICSASLIIGNLFSLASAEESESALQKTFQKKYEESGLCEASIYQGQPLVPADAPSNLAWERTAEGLYQLSWVGSSHPQGHYLIFASNDINAVSILLEKTAQSCITVDGRFSYYCVVAVVEGGLSAPSELLHLDCEVTPIPLDLVSKRAKQPMPYVKSRFVDDEAWAAVQPYLLPLNHPLKPKLDKLFSAGRVTATIESMKQAGFVLNQQQGLHVVVARHPDLKKVVVKAYLDFKSQECEWKKWVRRVQAANAIRAAIDDHGFTSLFKVPKKWIYPLPDTAFAPDRPEFFRKNFILVAEDMKLLDAKDNKKRHRSAVMTRELLESIFVICEELGLADTPRLANLAWAKDHRLAFVDTEAYQRWPVKYHSFFENLHKPNRPIWEAIISHARQE